nr:MAG TPA: hypothetical protein [Caudoviricetes sp.]
MLHKYRTFVLDKQIIPLQQVFVNGYCYIKTAVHPPTKVSCTALTLGSIIPHR